MKARKIFLYVDVVVQAVLITAILVSIIIFSLGIGQYNDLAGYGISATLFLGIWQVASSIILIIATGDEWRLKYLMGVLIWFVSIFFTFVILDSCPAYIAELIVYIIYLSPIAFAIAYFRHTYLHLLKITSLPISFWKLK